MIAETRTRRILGAFVCKDAITQESVSAPLSATSQGWLLKPNRSGIYAILDGPNLDKWTTELLPGSDWPKATNFEVTVNDPQRFYLPRRIQLSAPQTVPAIPPAPAGSASNPAAIAALSNPAAVFDPQPVPMYRGPAAPVAPNWATLHVSVTRAGTTPPQGLGWAVLRVVQTSNSAVLAAGVADLNGEALIAVPGLTLQTATSGAGPVTVSTVAVTVTAYFDPANLNQPSGWVPNPDDILNNVTNPALKFASQALQIASGQELPLDLIISV